MKTFPPQWVSYYRVRGGPWKVACLGDTMKESQDALHALREAHYADNPAERNGDMSIVTLPNGQKPPR